MHFEATARPNIVTHRENKTSFAGNGSDCSRGDSAMNVDLVSRGKYLVLRTTRPVDSFAVISGMTFRELTKVAVNHMQETHLMLSQPLLPLQ